MGSSTSSSVVPFSELKSSDELVNICRYKLIWIDKNINAIENLSREIDLKNLIEDLFVFQNLINAEQKIKEIKIDKIFVILNGDINENHLKDFLFNIHQRNEIASIYIYSQDYQSLRQLLRPICKVRYLCKNFDSIFKKFEKDLNVYQNIENITFIPNPLERLSTNPLNFLNNLSNVCNNQFNNQMKQTLFNTYQNCYPNNNKTIKEFKDNFEVSTSFYWFIEEPLISRLFNSICYRNYWNSMWKFEYLIKCLFIKLKEEHLLFKQNLLNKNSLIYVYLGQLMNIFQFKRLKMLIGKNILITNFILADFDKENTIDYINQCQPSSNEICFMFKIIINTNLKYTQPYAPIYFNHQKKLLFMLGTNFHILDFILNPHDQFPIVLLQLYNNKYEHI